MSEDDDDLFPPKPKASRPRARVLDPAEEADWAQVASRVRRLKKAQPAPGPAPEPTVPAMRSRGMLGPGAGPLGVYRPPRAAAPPALPPPAAPGAGPPPIAPKLLRDIRRGQVPIDAKLDLHGETQARAYPMLERFLRVARQRGNRVILVVTGSGVKRDALRALRQARGEAETAPAPRGLDADFMGRAEPGVLKRALPGWLAAAPLRDWVVGCSAAAPQHGGSGAVYLVLRRG